MIDLIKYCVSLLFSKSLWGTSLHITFLQSLWGTSLHITFLQSLWGTSLHITFLQSLWGTLLHITFLQSLWGTSLHITFLQRYTGVPPNLAVYTQSTLQGLTQFHFKCSQRIVLLPSASVNNQSRIRVRLR